MPLIVIIPGPNDVADYQNDIPRHYQSLNRYLNKRGYRHHDFLGTLLEVYHEDVSEDALFVQRHFQGHVNRELAAKIIEMIK